jgi:hypothetical protein
MKAHRTIIFIGGLVLALAAVLPANALASSLLSGYGGPGQGNQAILGAALVNGPKGGGGSSGSGGSSNSSNSSTSGSGSASAPASSRAGSGSGGSESSGSSPPARRSGGKSRREKAHNASSGATGATGFYPASERIAAGQQSGALGLSGSDVAYIVLALGLLGFIGVLTRRLAQTSAAGRPR